MSWPFLSKPTKERGGDEHVNDVHEWPLTSRHPIKVIKLERERFTT